MGSISTFFRELRRRRVLRMSAGYIIAAWVLVQITDLILPAFNIHESAIRYAWLAVVLGFPIALIFSWKYDVTTQGILRTPALGQNERVDLRLKKTDYALLTLLIALVAAGVFDLSQRTLQMEHVADRQSGLRQIFQNSIAVMPLENLSSDPEQAFFSAGMHDQLITSLSKITALRVTSRLSTLRVGDSLTVPEIGQALRVARVIEGSVMKAGDKVRIIVQLINAATDEHIWAETYERTMGDIMSLQGEVARSIAQAIDATLTPEEERALTDYREVSPEVYEAYMRGMFFIHKETTRGYRKGIEILTEALGNDPDNALAHAGVAYGYAMLGHNAAPQSGLYPKAKAAALKALELDDRLPEAHQALGMFRMYFEYDWAGAREAFERALELNPSLAGAHYHYAWLLELFGDREGALAAGEKTRELSPISAFYASYLAEQYRHWGMYDEALEEVEAVLELNPKYPVALMVRGALYAETGEFEKAIELHRKISKWVYWRYPLIETLVMAGREEEALEEVESIEKEQRYSLILAKVYATLGDREQAIYWLKEAYDYRTPYLPWLLAWWPEQAFFADDPGAQEIARLANLEDVVR
jgi:TolB-like protein/Tfp pilus assembly protein PilF